MRLGDGLKLGAASVLIAAIVSWPLSQALEGWSIDLLHGLRYAFLKPGPRQSETVVIAIDEETYRNDKLKDIPRALWTPQIGQVLSAVLDANPRVIGLDLVLSTSAETVVPGYDRDFHLALQRGAREGKIVLAYARHQDDAILPYRVQVIAVGGEQNLRSANVETDRDDIVRRLDLFPSVKGAPVPAFATELSMRSSIPVEVSLEPLVLNFDPSIEPPTLYSFADLLQCARSGNGTYFKKAFENKTVLLGGVLDIEDRKIASNRFAVTPEGQNYADRCKLAVQTKIYSGVSRDSIPGVYIHAAAIENLRQRLGLITLNIWQSAIVALVLAGLTAFLFFRLRIRGALPGLILVALAWTTISLGAFTQTLVLPLVGGLLAIALAAPSGLAIRALGSDRARRQLRRAFSYYMPASEVDQLVAQEKLPELGGELREITILFSDIAKYSTLSESLAPKELVTDLNRYLERMTDIVQSHGGFVDKYIGDGILAVFGAPKDQPDHSSEAVQAALEMVASLEREPLKIGNGKIVIRIGVHRGLALVGNIGHPRRFNYTAVGDAVNVAARLEPLGKRYARPIIISETVRRALPSSYVCRELDLMRVVGRDQPIALYEPLPKEDQNLDLSAFANAIRLWRAGEFGAAGQAFRLLAEAGDVVAQRYSQWCDQYLKNPPSQWSGILQQESK